MDCCTAGVQRANAGSATLSAYAPAEHRLVLLHTYCAGEMGGFIGLLLGASVLTLFEIIDLFVYNAFAKYCCRRVAPRKNNNVWA